MEEREIYRPEGKGREDEAEEEVEKVREKGQGTSRMVRPHQIICCWLAFPCPCPSSLTSSLIGSRNFISPPGILSTHRSVANLAVFCAFDLCIAGIVSYYLYILTTAQ
jgi:hypothetical protein